ncbi:hypothetical protein ACFQX7_30235, partial [Luedemannella flava]
MTGDQDVTVDHRHPGRGPAGTSQAEQGADRLGASLTAVDDVQRARTLAACRQRVCDGHAAGRRAECRGSGRPCRPSWGSRSSSSSSSAAGTGRWAGAPRSGRLLLGGARLPPKPTTLKREPRADGLEETAERGRGRLGPGLRHGRGGRRRGGAAAPGGTGAGRAAAARGARQATRAIGAGGATGEGATATGGAAGTGSAGTRASSGPAVPLVLEVLDRRGGRGRATTWWRSKSRTHR